MVSAHSKTYCLGCRKSNACSCGTTKLHFQHSHKLRPPRKEASNSKWRQFLRDCPQFINLVPTNLCDEMNLFLKDIKFQGPNINHLEYPLIVVPKIDREGERFKEYHKAP